MQQETENGQYFKALFDNIVERADNLVVVARQASISHSVDSKTSCRTLKALVTICESVKMQYKGSSGKGGQIRSEGTSSLTCRRANV